MGQTLGAARPWPSGLVFGQLRLKLSCSLFVSGQLASTADLWANVESMIGYKVREEKRQTSNTFIGRVEKIFKNLPKSLEWKLFYRHVLRILMDISQKVKNLAIQNGLSRAQILALETLRPASSAEYQKVPAHT